jgi:hypothetical protein
MFQGWREIGKALTFGSALKEPGRAGLLGLSKEELIWKVVLLWNVSGINLGSSS